MHGVRGVDDIPDVTFEQHEVSWDGAHCPSRGDSAGSKSGCSTPSDGQVLIAGFVTLRS